MADPQDTGEVMPELEGWGFPPPRAELVDRVLARIDDEAAARRRAWVRPFVLGGVVGGALVGLAVAVHGTAVSPVVDDARGVHLQVPGVGEVVGEPRAGVRWRRRGDGSFVIEIDEGVAWVRRFGRVAPVVVAGDDEVELGGACARVEVVRALLVRIDVSVDTVDCAEVDAAIVRAGAELSTDEPR